MFSLAQVLLYHKGTGNDIFWLSFLRCHIIFHMHMYVLTEVGAGMVHLV